MGCATTGHRLSRRVIGAGTRCTRPPGSGPFASLTPRSRTSQAKSSGSSRRPLRRLPQHPGQHPQRLDPPLNGQAPQLGPGHRGRQLTHGLHLDARGSPEARDGVERDSDPAARQACPPLPKQPPATPHRRDSPESGGAPSNRSEGRVSLLDRRLLQIRAERLHDRVRLQRRPGSAPRPARPRGPPRPGSPSRRACAGSTTAPRAARAGSGPPRRVPAPPPPLPPCTPGSRTRAASRPTAAGRPACGTARRRPAMGRSWRSGFSNCRASPPMT